MRGMFVGTLLFLVGLGASVTVAGRSGVPLWLFTVVLGLVSFRHGWVVWQLDRRLRSLEDARYWRPPSKPVSSPTPEPSPQAPPPSPPTEETPSPADPEEDVARAFGIELDEPPQTDADR